MKIAISSRGESLDSQVDPRFGRCAYLLLVDDERGAIVGGGENPFAAAPAGAGTRMAQWAIELGAEAVITGDVGPKAFDVLQSGALSCFTGAAGTVREALADHARGALSEALSATRAQRGGGPLAGS